MATFQKALDWALIKGTTANLATDTFKFALSNTDPTSESSNPLASGNGVLANVTQISYTNYSDDLTTDRQLENVTYTDTEVAGRPKFDADNFTITASGGTLADFGWLYVYDDTLAGDPIVGVWEIGSTISLSDGSNADFNINANGLFTDT